MRLGESWSLRASVSLPIKWDGNAYFMKLWDTLLGTQQIFYNW